MCVWYLKVWPLSTWVPARQQVEGSLALRDYLLLLSYFLFYWSGVAVHEAGMRFLRVMLSFLQLLHLRWVICHIVALACLLVNLLGIGLHHLKDKDSCLVDHCFTSHYSSLWDVQIDRILHTLIIVCNIVSLQSVGLSYLGMVTCWWIILRSLLPVAWCGFAKFIIIKIQ
jgi:hypothetical protein